MGNVHAVDAGDPDEMQASLERIKRNWGAMLEFGQLRAKLRRQWYESYCAQGFTEAQALELVKHDMGGG